MQKNKKNKGFTIIEILISFFLFAVAILPIMYLIKNYLLSAEVSRKKMIAYNLAVEALEILRNIRDSNYTIAGKNWLDGFSTSTCTIGEPNFRFCDVDYLSSQVLDLGPDGTDVFLLKNSLNLFNHQSGDITEFSRRIYYKKDSYDPNFTKKINVVVEVKYAPRLGKKKTFIFQAEYFLYNFLNQI